jgi:hypothetical protein
MRDFPDMISRTSIWTSTLAQRGSDPHELPRARLRNSFAGFRSRAALLASEIRRDLPDLTVHDVTHLDALWEVASAIVGPDYEFTPAEAFVLGGSILLHDLAMSVAATPNGLDGLRADPRWADIVTSEYRLASNRDPTAAEMVAPDQKILNKVLFSLLRLVHAENAERLAFLPFPPGAEAPTFLLEDAEARQTFGRLIGQIAHSHWWSIAEVERRFAFSMGAPPWCPTEWIVDPMKVACALRVADAAHLDARRAPTFLKAISRIGAASEAHWRFQEKLVKPYLKDDALVFTSGETFRREDATAWWLCLESLRMVDKELRSVDALLADKGKTRFAARRVAGVDTPERLAGFVTTERWLPINATLHVTDLPRLIRNLGGKELYGSRPEVPVRELIQNAGDAIRARRLLQGRGESYGTITISLAEDDQDYAWLEVADDGLGMSRNVLTDFLLDFGRSFWGSPQMLEEFPGLLASGVQPTGKYGIGFFSVFMNADYVQVITRRCDLGMSDTLVLEFGSGLAGRPMLREADKTEQLLLLDGGTRVRLKLTKPPRSEGGLLWAGDDHEPLSLRTLCESLAPAIDANLISIQDGERAPVVSANDWRTMPEEQFVSRLVDSTATRRSRAVRKQALALAAKTMRPLTSADGSLVGRACITAGFASRQFDDSFVSGVVTVGGLASCSMSGIAGILLGESQVAARDSAKPIVSHVQLANWATEQAELIADTSAADDYKSACAQYIRLCGGRTGALPIAVHQERWVTYADIVALARDSDCFILVDHFEADTSLKVLKTYKLLDNVLVTRASGIPGLLQAGDRVDWPGNRNENFAKSNTHLGQTLAGAIIEALAEAWDVTNEPIEIFGGLDREKDVKVGKKGKTYITARAVVVRKPPASPSSLSRRDIE